ncbi:MAG: GDSL-type esterase/lipase family protein, partial [Bryobacteraceae bacterium]
TNVVLECRVGETVRPAVIAWLGAGRHHLTLFKRSEANAGTVSFRGVELADGARVWTATPPAYKLAIEFIGDSITAGACDEDGPLDQWDDRRTHNAALSYAAITTQALGAEHRNIAVSGMGIITGYVEVKAGEVWDRIYPRANSPRVDLSKWRPQVVFVNLGENDNSYPSTRKEPFPPGFTDGYVALVRAIRSGYPSAQIVLLRGGMFGGARSATLRAAWEAAVAQLEGSDGAVHHYVFTHWTMTHPRVPDHAAMATELVDWLKTQDFMKAYGVAGK